MTDDIRVLIQDVLRTTTGDDCASALLRIDCRIALKNRYQSDTLRDLAERAAQRVLVAVAARERLN